MTVINFNTAAQTIRCVKSLIQCDEPPEWLLILDNASNSTDFDYLCSQIRPGMQTKIKIFRSEINLGFAAGSNVLIDCLLSLKDCKFVGLLNNDAVALPCLIQSLRTALENGNSMIGMAGGRMHRLADPDEVDTLGIAVYQCLMPADRKSTVDPYLGPTGGCCLMTRSFVEDIVVNTGYCFDSRYFCYCEDTDLVLRAQIIGYRPVYIDTLLALHEGQASTGGGGGNFVVYHGLRNAMWMQWKLMSPALRWRYALQLGLAHLFTIARQTLNGRVGLLWRIYRDAWRQRQIFIEEHKRLSRSSRVDWGAIESLISPRFYRKGYTGVVLAGWCARWFNRE